MSDDIEMCTAVKLKNFIEASDVHEGNVLEEATNAFEGEVIAQTLTGLKGDESHGVFYMYKDGSVAGIFSEGMVLSDAGMVLNGFIQTALPEFEKQNGKQRVRHDS